MRLDAFFSTDTWYAYEEAYGDIRGTRAALLATAPWKTRVLDLRPDEPTLWRGVRGSYHPIVNRLTRDPKFRIVEAAPSLFIDNCRALQSRVAPAETRSLASWEVQADWIRTGKGLCLLALRNGRLVAFSYAIVYQRWQYYGYGKTEDKSGAHHALMWALIRRSKSDGIHHFELGWQGEATTEKGRGVEQFKRGWGGVDMSFNAELE